MNKYHRHPTEEAFINMSMENNNMLGLKYRIYPSGVQQQKLVISLRLCKEIHNYLLQYCKDEYRKAKENGTTFSPTAFTMNYEVVRFKKEHPEYKEVWGHAFQGVSNHLGNTYASFFRRVREGKKGKKTGFPRFKKKVYCLLYPDAYGIGYKLESNKILNVSKIGRIPIKLDRAPKGNVKTMVISKDGNRWYVSFLTDYNKVMDKISEKRAPIGVDMGVKTFAALSDGILIENPKFYDKAKKKIKMLQRRHSKKKIGSHNRSKAGMKLWRAHQRVEDLRHDFIHKVTTDLVRNHDVIAIEDLKINNMLQNHRLAGSIADAGWGTFKTYLAYKAESAGCQVIYVDPRNTSQTCSCCGKVLEEKLNLSQRIFRCPCGFSEDRDVNAAKNILAIATLGLRGSQAGGETTSTLGEMDMNLEQVVSMKQELYGGEDFNPSNSNFTPSGTQRIHSLEDVKSRCNEQDNNTVYNLCPQVNLDNAFNKPYLPKRNMDDQPTVKPTRPYTTISISHAVKKELEQIIYSSGKAQKYDDLFREMIMLKKAQLELAAQKAMAKIAKEKEAI